MKNRMNFLGACAVVACGALAQGSLQVDALDTGTNAPLLDEARRVRAVEMIDRSEAYLRSQQDASGGWKVPREGSKQPVLPAVTGLVVDGLLLDARIDSSDPTVAHGLGFLLKYQQPDGGVYDRVLPNYNTSIALSAMAHAEDPSLALPMARAQQFLLGLQYGEGANEDQGGDESPQRVGPDHPFYGGVGYGKHGRPDNSNLSNFLQALHDAGMSPDDPAVKRAVAFLQRTQMHGSVNDMAFAEGSSQGGFVYSTVEDAQSVDGPAGQSMAGVINETLDDGTVVSRLRAYGSMTYAGFKSYLYADLPRDDPRVTLAFDWIRQHYSLDENPGLGQQGRYFYFVTFARSLSAWGEPVISVIGADGSVEDRNWRADLVDTLSSLQSEDGSFVSVHPRWMEDDPVLITAYALIALHHCTEARKSP